MDCATLNRFLKIGAPCPLVFTAPGVCHQYVASLLNRGGKFVMGQLKQGGSVAFKGGLGPGGLRAWTFAT